MSPEQLTLYATSVALKLSKDMSPEELCAVKNFLSHVHCTLCTIAAQSALCERCGRESGHTGKF